MKGADALEEGPRRSWLAKLLRRKHAEPQARVVTFPRHSAHTLLHPHGGRPHYRGNRTATTKYTLLSFLPKALFEQYRRVANIYFTLNAALSLTKYSPVRPWTTFLPLVLVLGVAMIKEAIEDYKRHRQDVEVNNRRVEVFDPEQKKFVHKTWADVQVGDVITVFKDEYFPADLLFLSSESEDGLCYIETMQLDGETNLKIKKALDETRHLTRDTLGGFAATVRCEPPNSRLYHFTGNLEMPTQLSGEPIVVPVPPASVLLRGCSLRNTHRIYGLVLYAGHDTKIFMNSTQPPSKRSQVERTVDRIILFMFSLLFAMCIVGCISFARWTTRQSGRHWYLLGAVPTEFDPAHPAVVGVTNFVTAFILYSFLIPISLYVSIEMVKIVQAFLFIGHDREMYHAESGTPAVARTSNLNEELGMVNTILTDKTGTLTRNVMEFFKASIGGVSYGAGVTEIERANASRRGVALDGGDGGPGPGGANPCREPYFNFYDERVMGGAWAGQPNPHLAKEFFRMLALCHTVIPDGPPDPKLIRYEAESPDEAALVVAAKVFGFFFFKRTNTTLYLRESLPEGVQEVEYEVLNILEFNSTRKRMSVVLRSPDNRILLYCKGADTVIYERLAKGHPTNEALREVTLAHMEDYGGAGLRTLCLAFRELNTTSYDAWQERYIDAKTSLENRQARVDEVSEEIERDLVLLGCTAIEDKLQEGVPQAIKALADADIRLWVLTGDKMETAINISYACSLITDEMVQFQVTGHNAEVEALEAQGLVEDAVLAAGEHVQLELERISKSIAEDALDPAPRAPADKYALVIDGKALLYALSPMLKDLFLQVSLKCSAVVCCRVSPLQKAQVTALVKSHGDVTLAIGDGANDVGMIQKAHIGVGISGQEGMQAVMASDFAIAQFRFLTPLLLVHGRLSYKRITRMILFFFYKNLLFGITIFVYNAFALFSGQRVYNDIYMTMFNVVFTAASPLVVGWFDRDLDKGYGLRFPLLYRDGQRNLYFNARSIVGWLFVAVLHAAIILTAVLAGAHPSEVDRIDGHTVALEQTGILMFTIVIVTVHVQLAVLIDQWTWMHHASFWGSIALWPLFLLAYGAMPLKISTDLYHLFSGAIANAPFFWLASAVVPAMCVIPVFAFRQMMRHLRPHYYQVVQEIAARERRGETVYEGYGPATTAPSGTATPGPAAAAAAAAAQLTGMLSRAGRAVTRVARTSVGGVGWGGIGIGSGGGAEAPERRRRTRYSGFVPPYEAKSRVFDSNELRASAAAAGYTISTTGDVGGPRKGSLSAASGTGGFGGLLGMPSRGVTASGALGGLLYPMGSGTGGGGSASGGTEAPAGGWGSQLVRVPSAGAVSSAGGGAAAVALRPSVGPGAGAQPHFASAALARALSGMAGRGGPGHRRTASAGAVLGVSTLAPPPAAPSVATTPGFAAAAAAGEEGPFHRVSIGSGGALAPCGSGRASAVESLLQPPEESSYAGNPVLERLEQEFTRDPRRHQHGRKLSFLSVPAMPRSRSGPMTPGGRTPHGSSPRPSPVAAALGALLPGGGGGGGGGAGSARASGRGEAASEGGAGALPATPMRSQSGPPHLELEGLELATVGGARGGWPTSGGGAPPPAMQRPVRRHQPAPRPPPPQAQQQQGGRQPLRVLSFLLRGRRSGDQRQAAPQAAVAESPFAAAAGAAAAAVAAGSAAPAPPDPEAQGQPPQAAGADPAATAEQGAGAPEITAAPPVTGGKQGRRRHSTGDSSR